MNVAYVRVSTVEQNEARQKEALAKYEIEKWFIEKVSGKDTNREVFQNMMEFVREGDETIGIALLCFLYIINPLSHPKSFNCYTLYYY